MKCWGGKYWVTVFVKLNDSEAYSLTRILGVDASFPQGVSVAQIIEVLTSKGYDDLPNDLEGPNVSVIAFDMRHPSWMPLPEDIKEFDIISNWLTMQQVPENRNNPFLFNIFQDSKD